MLHHGAAVALLLAAACSSKPSNEPKQEPKEQPPAAAASSCDARVDRFAAALKPVATGGGVPVPTSIDPIESTKGTPATEYGPSVVIRRDGIYLNDYELVNDIDDLRARLAAEVDMMRAMDRASALYIWADKAVSAKQVAIAVDAAPANMPVRFMLAGPVPEMTPYQKELLAHPPTAKFLDEMHGGDPSRRAMLAAEAIEKSIGLCSPLIRAFGDVAAMDASQKGPFMADAAPKALRQCKCGVADIDLLEYALLAIMGAFDRKVSWVPASEAGAYLGQ